MRNSCEELIFELTKDSFYGNSTFRSEKIICEVIRPKLDGTESKIEAVNQTLQSEHEDSFDNPLQNHKSGETGGEEESKTPSISSEDSDVDIDIQDAQLTDKIAIIQEWLFTSELPAFSKSEEIMELLKTDDDLGLFFKFIVTPFKSMIHHLVRKIKFFIQNF